MKKIESTRTFKAGYQIHYGCWSYDEGKTWTPIRWATNLNGDYIGESRDAYRLCQKRGIAPILRTADSGVCSIGFSEREQKWYGWSHRAIYGFGVGDIVEEGDVCAMSGWTDEYLAEHPDEDDSLPIGFIAKTLDDARTMACAFASGVS